MIIGPDFIWVHFPKTGGMAVEHFLSAQFKDRPDVQFDKIDKENVIWHQSVQTRRANNPSFVIGDRRVICGFRRLPFWLMSRATFEAQRPPYRTATRGMIERSEFYENSGTVSKPDNYLSLYASDPVTHWIRTEHLEDDLASAFNMDVSTIKAGLTKQNSSKKVSAVEFWFTAEQLQRLYERNPLWAAHELKLYGSLLTVNS